MINIYSQPRLLPSNDATNQSLGGRDIYATMRQSSGSNFFLNRKDHIVIKGFLNKKSMVFGYFCFCTTVMVTHIKLFIQFDVVMFYTYFRHTYFRMCYYVLLQSQLLLCLIIHKVEW